MRAGLPGGVAAIVGMVLWRSASAFVRQQPAFIRTMRRSIGKP
jgi:hypothetical protein